MTALRTRMLATTALVAVLVALGLLVQLAALTHLGLQADTGLTGIRSEPLTAVAIGFTQAAQEAVGIAALLVGLVALWLRRRRVDALRLLCVAGISWGAAFLIKTLLDRPRPPAALRLLQPDLTGSFPSGHTTTAAVIVVIVYLAFRHTRLSTPVVTLGVMFAVGVGTSRLYLGDHYPADVLASYLIVATATLAVSTVFALGPVRHATASLLRTTDITASQGNSAEKPAR